MIDTKRDNGSYIPLPEFGRFETAEDAAIEAERIGRALTGIVPVVIKTSFAIDRYMVGREVKVGDYINQHLFSDVNPFKVIAITKSGKTVTIAPVEAKRNPEWKPEIVPGGFAGHCTNNREQQWIYGGICGSASKVRLGAKGWAQGLYRASKNPVKFHDYNF